MKTKIYNLLSVLFISLIFNSCFYAKTTFEDSASNDTLSLNEALKISAEKCFRLITPADSVNSVTTSVLAVDSFTFKQNIDYRRNQINDSIKLTNNNSKILHYKRTIYLLDSIEKSLGQHVNDLISYKYEYTKHTTLPNDTLDGDNKTTVRKESITATVYFYTDATPTRQLIFLPTENKDKIVNPLEYPDYYKRIDRVEITK
jgi:hypothetical protein